MEDLTDYISGHRFFEGMAEKHLALIAGCAHEVNYKAGEFLCREGDQADYFYLIIKGRVALETHTPPLGTVRILTRGEGDVVGIDWLFAPYKRSFDLRAINAVQTLNIDGRCLRGECVTDHELGYQLMDRFSQSLAKLLKETRLQLLETIHEHAME